MNRSTLFTGLALMTLGLAAQPEVFVAEAHAGKSDIICRALSSEFNSVYYVFDWTSTDEVYQDMVAYGCNLTVYEHTGGARAAKALGNIYNAIDRFDLAGNATEVATLEASYGEVKLDFRGYPRTSLTRIAGSYLPSNMPAYNAVALAQDAMDGPEKWHGYLPQGTYEVAGSVTFFVTGGGPYIELP